MSIVDTALAFARWDPRAAPLPAALVKAGGGTRAVEAELPPPAYQGNLISAAWSPPDYQTYLVYMRSSSVIQAILGTQVTDFTQGRPRVERVSDGAPLPDHPLQTLLDTPAPPPLPDGPVVGTPAQGRAAFLAQAMMGRVVTGASYLYLVPAAGGTSAPGPIAKMVAYPHGLVEPLASPLAWVDHYIYKRTPGDHVRLELPAIIPWFWSPDPARPGWPLPPFAALVKEVDSDLELMSYIKALLQNDATPRTMLTIPKEVPFSPQDAARFKQDWQRMFGGDNRGAPAVLTGGAAISRLGLALNELETGVLRYHWESRACAVLHTPAILAGLEVGLVHGTYSNFQQAREYFIEQTMVPAWDTLADALTAGLCTPALYGTDVRVAFDLSRVRALTESEDAKQERGRKNLRSAAITVNEYRTTILGMEAHPEGDVFLLAESLTGDKLSKPHDPADQAAADLVAAAPHTNGREH